MNSIKLVSVEEELKRNPELKKEDLQHLKEWYSKQPHLPQCITDSELIIFLHSKYYRLEPTKNIIENYFTCRSHIPEFFSNRDPLHSKELRVAMGTLFMMPLEKKTAEGYSVIYARMLNSDPKSFFYDDGMRLCNMIQDLWTLQSGTIKGHVFVFDIIGVQMVHLLRVSPMSVKKYLWYLQEAIPFRIKSLHFLNTTSVMDYILKLIKPFMKKEFSDMLYLHPNLDSLSKYVPIDILPKETGGKAGSMKDLYAPVLKNLENHRNYFLEEEKIMRVNEALRQSKTNLDSSIFGIEGSFKSLSID